MANVSPAPLPLPYHNVQDTVSSSGFMSQIQVALAIAGYAAFVGGGDAGSVTTYCVNPSQDVIRRCAYRLFASGALTSITPTDAQVQTAVNALIPASGAFSL